MREPEAPRMYVPAHFRITDPQTVGRFIEAHPFATIVANGGEGTAAAHVPVLLDGVEGSMLVRSHVARANPLWRALDGRDALAIFLGPHAYVSPRWYETRDNVPTWDYMAVHVRGTGRIVADRQRALGFLSALSERFERGAADPWSLDELDATRRDRFLDAIVVFEIAVTHVDASFKLSQNRTPEERRSVAAALRAEGLEELADAIARA